MSGDESVRVSDADRERTAQRLARAQAEGRLELVEFDERVRAAYGATTRADLAPLTADLPVEGPAGRVEHAAGDRRAPAYRGAAVAVAIWAVVSALNLGIWAIVSLAAPGPVHPWWIWVAGPWGVVLALRLLAERSGLVPPMPFVPAPVPGWGCAARGRR
jgi:hypothetical protein